MSFEEVEQEKRNTGDYSDLVVQTPSIKIVKNSKGYNFEFKILSNDIEEMDRIHNLIVEKIKEWEEKEK